MFNNIKERVFYSPDEDGGSSQEEERVVSPLDMEPTISWYEKNAKELLKRLPKPEKEDAECPFEIEDIDFMSLTRGEIIALLNLFPEQARNRSVLKSIVGKPSLWFKKGPEQKPTTDPQEMLSPTAIIPSFHCTDNWPNTDIHLFQIPENACSAQVAKIIHAEGLLHEFGHSIVTPEVYADGNKFQLPSGRVIESKEFVIEEFKTVLEDFQPISHYATFFRDEKRKFKGDLRTSVNEELVESIAAYFLGFVFSDDEKRRLDPFKDRPEVKKLVYDFLNAEQA